MVSMLVTGLISSSWYGWPMVFYLYGAAGLVWCLIFIFFGYNAPSFHPKITEEEKFYIESSLGHADDKPVSWVNVKLSIFFNIGVNSTFTIQYVAVPGGLVFTP